MLSSTNKSIQVQWADTIYGTTHFHVGQPNKPKHSKMVSAFLENVAVHTKHKYTHIVVSLLIHFLTPRAHVPPLKFLVVFKITYCTQYVSCIIASGMSRSPFRPSDDAHRNPYPVPSSTMHSPHSSTPHYSFVLYLKIFSLLPMLWLLSDFANFPIFFQRFSSLSYMNLTPFLS
jgi:hypothetical protein